jgi:hypothetical protein
MPKRHEAAHSNSNDESCDSASDRSRVSQLPKRPKSKVCNFRAPDWDQFQKWQAYKKCVKDKGLDICRVTLGLAESFVKGGTVSFQTPPTSHKSTTEQRLSISSLEAQERALQFRLC